MEIDAHVLSVMESTISGDYAVYCLENGALHMLLRSAGLPLLSGMSAREYDALTEKDAAEIVLAADRQAVADRLEEMILAEGPDTVAAFIGEPVLGTGGIIRIRQHRPVFAITDSAEIRRL